jgi:hypothetical protein
MFLDATVIQSPQQYQIICKFSYLTLPLRNISFNALFSAFCAASSILRLSRSFVTSASIFSSSSSRSSFFLRYLRAARVLRCRFSVFSMDSVASVDAKGRSCCGDEDSEHACNDGSFTFLFKLRELDTELVGEEFALLGVVIGKRFGVSRRICLDVGALPASHEDFDKNDDDSEKLCKSGTNVRIVNVSLSTLADYAHHCCPLQQQHSPYQNIRWNK